MSTALRRRRTGCQLARLNRRTKARNRAEVLDALMWPVALGIVLAVYVGVCVLVGQ